MLHLHRVRKNATRTIFPTNHHHHQIHKPLQVPWPPQKKLILRIRILIQPQRREREVDLPKRYKSTPLPPLLFPKRAKQEKNGRRRKKRHQRQGLPQHPQGPKAENYMMCKKTRKEEENKRKM